jgi:hypothetical protein
LRHGDFREIALLVQSDNGSRILIEQLDALWTTGSLLAVHPVSSDEESDDEIRSWLEPMESMYRLQLPDQPPNLNPESAVWAARQFYRAAQLVVHRELGEAFIQSGLELEPRFDRPVPSEKEHASIHYSVDLHFRFLPDLMRIAGAMSPTDPLIDQLNAWSDRWPLSGARIASQSIEAPLSRQLEPILSNRCLRILYIERRFSDPKISHDEVLFWNQVSEQHDWKPLGSQ